MTNCCSGRRLMLCALTFASAITLAGCPAETLLVRKGERASEALSAEPALPDSTGGPDSDQAHRPTPGLPEPIDSMTNAELFAYLDTLVYEKVSGNKHRVMRACLQSDGTPCSPGDSTEVMIQPEWGMNEVSSTAIPPHGIVVARFVNYGSFTEAEYRLPPGARAWWLVDRDSTGQLRSRMITRTYASVGKTYGNDSLSYTFTDCGDRRKLKDDAKAKWSTCEDAGATHVSDGTAMVRIIPVAIPASARAAKASSWVTCSLGCCIAGD